MKKILFASMFLCLAPLSRADVAPTVPSSQPLSIYLSAGPLSLTIPGQSFRLVGLYDVVSKSPLAGAETVFAILKIDKSSTDPWDLEATGGAVTDAAAKGAPILGVNLAKQNPSAAYLSVDNLKLGVFAGYNFNAGNGSSKPIMAGVKMAYEMRFW